MWIIKDFLRVLLNYLKFQMGIRLHIESVLYQRKLCATIKSSRVRAWKRVRELGFAIVCVLGVLGGGVQCGVLLWMGGDS